ncbi:LTA synthase family protein [Bombiscardovia coagulans]|uniref:Phosphoglycerol transferase, contains sulfatase domain n=1 Tax=Bombiscardovia coagulans TaxID=686666 RepID=A0A261EU62_9BIFI|nr:sulfatase-like hydrolase/transferase [Bombiscardovia coagulans]OZG50186.1 Phosphoglycerol transferase, contains sulfatase domain [Bombiscardovia coagulans]
MTEANKAAEHGTDNTAPLQHTQDSKEQGKGVSNRFKAVSLRGKWKPATWVYAVLFVVFDIVAVALLQWGVTLSTSRVALSNPLIGFWGFVSAMWNGHRFVFILNLLAIGLVYLLLLFLCNRFWVATPVLLTVAGVIAVIEHFKVASRYETILPSDLNFLHADAGNIVSFLPTGSFFLIVLTVVLIFVLMFASILLSRVDSWHGRVVRTGNKGLGASIRCAGVVVPTLVLALFMSSVGTYGTWANSFSRWMGDLPSMWDSVYDAQRNGTFVSFSRQLNPKIMDEPSDYNQASMEKIVKRYSKQADIINKDRASYLNENTLVYILSESFSDPSRAPGVQLNADPMPNIRSIKKDTTSGLMLSSGYGGGTANMEFQALSGLSMANFDPSLTSPYQQVIPDLKWMPMVNQNWGGSEHSLAFHPYEPSMYSRAQNYKTFGFSHFYTLAGNDIINHQEHIDNSPYVSDAAAYQSALEAMQAHRSNQFVEVITMQNHMPYNDWYKDNTFQVSVPEGAPDLGEDELTSIHTYAKGVSLTDQATQSFIDSINHLDKPVTVVFYGDHLPGIYNTASADMNNSLALHLTDYFIWSNKASASHGTDLPNSAYTSPNFFTAQAARHMNAKVSPYLAFLTGLQDKISAIEPPVVNQIQGWERIPEGQTIYLDATGKPMDARSFDERTQQLLHDYKLIQYDIMAGKQYLRGSNFMTAPTRASDKKAAEAAAKRKATQADQQARKERTETPVIPGPDHTTAQ